MNKKQLYESIMRSVSVQVKKVLNENVPFYEKTAKGKQLSYICTPTERKFIEDYADGDDISKKLEDIGLDDEYQNVEIDTYIEDITLGGMHGTIDGTITYAVKLRIYEDWDGEYADGSKHSWMEYEILDYNIAEYDLLFVDDENNNEYIIYMNAKDAQRKEDYTTPVKRAYDQRIAVERRLEREEMLRERQKKEQEFIDKCKSDPEKYIALAKKYEQQYENNETDYWILSDAEKIYNALGMTKEARRMHNLVTSEYHKEEYRAGLL